MKTTMTDTEELKMSNNSQYDVSTETVEVVHINGFDDLLHNYTNIKDLAHILDADRDVDTSTQAQNARALAHCALALALFLENE